MRSVLSYIFGFSSGPLTISTGCLPPSGERMYFPFFVPDLGFRPGDLWVKCQPYIPILRFFSPLPFYMRLVSLPAGFGAPQSYLFWGASHFSLEKRSFPSLRFSSERFHFWELYSFPLNVSRPPNSGTITKGFFNLRWPGGPTTARLQAA